MDSWDEQKIASYFQSGHFSRFEVRTPLGVIPCLLTAKASSLLPWIMASHCADMRSARHHPTVWVKVATQRTRSSWKRGQAISWFGIRRWKSFHYFWSALKNRKALKKFWPFLKSFKKIASYFQGRLFFRIWGAHPSRRHTFPPNSKGKQFAPLNIGKSLCRYEKRKTSPDRLGRSGNTKNPFKLEERTWI